MMDEIIANVEQLVGELSYDERNTAEHMIKNGYDSQAIANKLKSNNSCYI